MSEFDRLAEENRELKWRLRDLFNRHDGLEQRVLRSLATQARLEQRLHRVEISIVFRFLQWLGRRLRLFGVSVSPGTSTLGRANDTGTVLDQSYSNWVEEVVLRERIWESTQAALATARPSPSNPPRISILLNSRQSNRERLERTLSSIDIQKYSEWELFICTDAEPPEWLAGSVVDLRVRHPVEIVPGQNERAGFESALGKSRGEFIALIPADVILEPGAFERWIAALTPETVAVYSDWDHIDSEGRRHTPRFTPEISPELLSHTLYWGRCYLARTAQVRETSWPGGTPLTPLVEHDLALRLAHRSGSISRVPRMLWHLQDGGTAVPKPTPEASQRGTVRANGTASIIICSRNPDQLRKCLKALQPTLDARHEVIVVAHHLRDRPALEQSAPGFPVRTIAYEGAFHFGFMNSLGVIASRGQMICLLNDDVYPLTSDWLESMVINAARPEVGVVGALLLYPDGTIQHAGVAVGGWHNPAHVGRLQIESPYWPWLRITREVTAVTGACMVVRRSVWDELDGMDPRFPVNYNDIDFCLRAGKLGYRVLIDAQAVLTHEESRTRIPQVRAEEGELFYDRWQREIHTPDKYFNPQFGHDVDSIELPSPWTLVR